MLEVAKQNFERNPNDQTLANKFVYYKNIIRNAFKKLKNNILNILQTLLNMESNNPKEFWAVINFSDLDYRIKEDEILKKNKASGLDNLINELIIAGK